MAKEMGLRNDAHCAGVKYTAQASKGVLSGSAFERLANR